ncbi:uncharacterized protein LOC141842794 [Curcuma longa]|uniref:uncharacterized protein LOC141842794 n=1 Tax=Curcuma longa TaxID=136217 RepID=UPI003D9E8FE9
MSLILIMWPRTPRIPLSFMDENCFNIKPNLRPLLSPPHRFSSLPPRCRRLSIFASRRRQQPRPPLAHHRPRPTPPLSRRSKPLPSAALLPNAAAHTCRRRPLFSSSSLPRLSSTPQPSPRLESPPRDADAACCSRSHKASPDRRGFEQIDTFKFGEFEVIWLRIRSSFYMHLVEKDPKPKLPEVPSAVLDPSALLRGLHISFGVSNYVAFVTSLKEKGIKTFEKTQPTGWEDKTSLFL